MVLLGFIGTGHMGSMLIHKFIETGVAAPGDIIANNRTGVEVELLAKELSIMVGDNGEVAKRSDVIFLCVKPLDMKGILRELRDELTSNKLLISVAVDFSLDDIASISRARTARVIPSVTSERSKGVSLVVFGKETTASDRALIFSFFGTIGYPIEAEEKDLQVLANLTSSAPAYISAIMREIVKAAVRKGIAADMAEKLARQTISGTSELLDNESFDSMISRVATRGGITEEGVKAIQKHAPSMFDELFAATRDKHELVRHNIDAQR